MEEDEDTLDDEDDRGMKEHDNIQHKIQSYEPPKKTLIQEKKKPDLVQLKKKKT